LATVAGQPTNPPAVKRTFVDMGGLCSGLWGFSGTDDSTFKISCVRLPGEGKIPDSDELVLVVFSICTTVRVRRSSPHLSYHNPSICQAYLIVLFRNVFRAFVVTIAQTNNTQTVPALYVSACCRLSGGWWHYLTFILTFHYLKWNGFDRI
jgi:hypothetical protein